MFLRFRRLAQCAALLLLVALPWLNRQGFTGMKGSLFAFDACGFPFADPLSALQPLLTGMLPDGRILLGALVVLVVALCLGRIFCSWICPFGLLSELGQRIHHRRDTALRNTFRVRAALFAIGLGLTVLLGIPLLNQFSLPGGFSLGLINAATPLSDRAVHSTAEYGLFFLLPFLPILIVLVAEIATGRRLWCRFVCPQSVLPALMARLPVAPRLTRTMSRCTCGKTPACRAACPLDLDPRNPRSSAPLECTNCGACVVACTKVHQGAPAALCLERPKGSRPAASRK